MEDNVKTARVTVSAAFAIAMRNFASDPISKPCKEPVTIYHSMPFGLSDQL